MREKRLLIIETDGNDVSYKIIRKRRLNRYTIRKRLKIRMLSRLGIEYATKNKGEDSLTIKV